MIFVIVIVTYHFRILRKILTPMFQQRLAITTQLQLFFEQFFNLMVHFSHGHGPMTQHPLIGQLN